MVDVIELLSHRSKERIEELGEVFTPEDYVKILLNQIENGNKKIWSDESTIFFEPTCGHGNIVIPILKKRLNAFEIKAKRKGIKQFREYAVANALNTLWAIDFDSSNVDDCRKRIFLAIFLRLHNNKHPHKYIKSNLEFMAHLLCSIKWHCYENEALSALSCDGLSSTIKASQKWVAENGAQPIDFENSWVSFYRMCEKENAIPIEYERAVSFLENLLNGSSRGQSYYSFTEGILTPNKDVVLYDSSIREAIL